MIAFAALLFALCICARYPSLFLIGIAIYAFMHI